MKRKLSLIEGIALSRKLSEAANEQSWRPRPDWQKRDSLFFVTVFEIDPSYFRKAQKLVT